MGSHKGTLVIKSPLTAPAERSNGAREEFVCEVKDGWSVARRFVSEKKKSKFGKPFIVRNPTNNRHIISSQEMQFKAP